MKKLFYMLAVAGVMTLAGCSKEHQCKCVTTDIEGSVSCEDITEMAFEEHVSVEGGTTLRTVDVHKVNCRSYGD